MSVWEYAVSAYLLSVKELLTFARLRNRKERRLFQ
jgi:hypothetical protein